MKDIVIADLDGTIALIEHRRHFVRNGEHDWRSFYESCETDEPKRSL